MIKHSLVHRFESVPNSTEIWLLKVFKTHIELKTLWKKVKLLKMNNFTFFHNVHLKLFSSRKMSINMEERVKYIKINTPPYFKSTNNVVVGAGNPDYGLLGKRCYPDLKLM